MVELGQAVSSAVKYPEMRAEVEAALQSLSDSDHQLTRWGRVVEGVDYYDDLDLNIHTLYDDCRVLPDPASAVPEVLLDSDVVALSRLAETLGPIIDELGDRPEEEYLADPRWPSVLKAASAALSAMKINA